MSSEYPRDSVDTEHALFYNLEKDDREACLLPVESLEVGQI